MKHRKAPLALITLLAVSSACEQETTIEDRVSTYVAELNDQVAVYCDCWQLDEYSSYDECAQSYGYVGPSAQDCYVEALSRDEKAAASWLDCVVELERNYTACIDARLSCGDYESDEACLDDYDIGYAACVQLPENIERGLEGCAPQD